MGRVQVDTGLVSGINYGNTINQLIAIDAQPINALKNDNTSLTSQETALDQLSALLLSVQSVAKTLGNSTTYNDQTVNSSNSNVLTAAVTGTPTTGTYQYTPVRTVQTQQFLGSGVESTSTALGAGTLTFRYGAGVDRSTDLSALNDGAGFTRGKIEITDRSGASTQVDLSTCQTIGDVLNAINNAGTINVTAVADGSHIQLIDNTGQHASDLTVQEVGGGTTAKSLGLAGVDLAADSTSTSVDGNDVLKLYSGISLNALNDGNGIQTNTALPDISYTLRDGTTGTIDLSPIEAGTSTVDKETTLSQILDEINTQSGGKLTVAISSDGQSLVATDNTTPTGSNSTFSISGINGSLAAQDLGLVGSTTTGSITGSQILSGLQTVLLSSLNGGQGLGSLGTLQLTDRSGTTTSVDLSGAQTLDDVMDDINTQAAKAGVGITASINSSDDGIQLVDSTGSTADNLIVTSGSDGLGTAAKLGIDTTATGVAATSVDSGDMHLEVVSRNTLLSSLNGGTGVANGSFTVTNSSGNATTITLGSTVQTVGDVLDAINRSGAGVTAAIDSTGDGILLTDTAGGTGTLSVAEGSSTTAADLHLLNTASSSTTIDGTMTQTITLSSTDTLASLQTTINGLDAGLTASIISDGSSNPYHLTLTSSQTGSAGNLIVDASKLTGITLEQTAQGQDALLATGGSTSSGSGLLVASSTNDFTGVLPGVTLTVQNAATSPVTVTVASSDSTIASNLQTFVTDYNNFRSQLSTDTAFNTTTNSGSVLSSDPTAQQLDSQISNLITGYFSNSGSIHSLADLGVTVQTDGTLAFDQSTLDTAYNNSASDVQNFFSTATTGFSTKLSSLLDQLAGSSSNSLLSARVNSIQTQISDHTDRINELNTMLDNEQSLLYNSFYNMEVAISKLQSSQSIINSLDILTPLSASSSSSSS